jgi:diadenosine tetraphosphate (Ap4A) HIT family hydrolase
MQHYRKTYKKQYLAFNAGDRASSGCTFCKEVGGAKIVQETETMFVIPNRVAYDMFEGRRVIDHLMVIPKHHRTTIRDFTDKEKIDQMTIIGQYEPDGYNVYARGVRSISRSVDHQHTHLIKLTNDKPKFIFFAEKPHILIDR